jgi:hypothetical protein
MAEAGINQAAGRQLATAGIDSRLTDDGKVVSPTPSAAGRIR